MTQSKDMRTLQRESATSVRERAAVGRLDEGLETRFLDDVSERGVALVPGALAPATCRRLVVEADAARNRFLNLPPRVNGVRQRAEQLAVRIGDPLHPELHRLVTTLRMALAAQPRITGVHRFAATEARYMRYSGQGAGLGAHRDGKRYSLLVCVFSITGAAPFTVFGDGDEEPRTFTVSAGDLVLLRAPGFAGCADGRPRHAVGPPHTDERVSLTLRTVQSRSPVPVPAGCPRSN